MFLYLVIDGIMLTIFRGAIRKCTASILLMTAISTSLLSMVLVEYSQAYTPIALLASGLIVGLIVVGE
jgi:hypothetical protein